MRRTNQHRFNHHNCHFSLKLTMKSSRPSCHVHLADNNTFSTNFQPSFIQITRSFLAAWTGPFVTKLHLISNRSNSPDARRGRSLNPTNAHWNWKLFNWRWHTTPHFNLIYFILGSASIRSQFIIGFSKAFLIISILVWWNGVGVSRMHANRKRIKIQKIKIWMEQQAKNSLRTRVTAQKRD